MNRCFRAIALAALPTLLLGVNSCESEPTDQVYDAANQCFSLGAVDPGQYFPKFMSITESEDGYEFSNRSPLRAARFFLKPSGLGTYLFYDRDGSYLVSDGNDFLRESELESDVSMVDDSFESNAVWALESPDTDRLQLRHLKSGRYLAANGLVASEQQAAQIELFPRTACAEFPEASLDAEGQVRTERFPDGSVFGFVDTHSHILSNFAFGGGGIFHGAPFHELGIEHALADCELFHGPDGRRDFFGFVFDHPGAPIGDLVFALLGGETPNPNHATAGYPDFTEWPDAHTRSTHQVQYYKWLERAYLSGLRLVVQHAVSNAMICDLMVAFDLQPTRYSCNDMVAVDRSIDEVYAMQDYIDAQEGGPGKGWFRIVTTPAQAREIIDQGKMAVVLGIETSNLFDCFLTPSEEFPACTEQDVIERLDAVHARGVRAIFPVHKYDNGFSAGDGHKFIIELGNFLNTGHYANFTTDCPSIPTVFDRGNVVFPDLNMPREDYLSPAPYDFSGFVESPFLTLVPFLDALLNATFEGPEVCQSTGMTELGEFLIEQMMARGMILEIDHLPRRSYQRAFEMLEQNDYPAAGTHGLNNNGELYRLGGVSKTGFGTCHSESASATVDDGFQNRIQLIEDMGGFPAEGFGFDLNGFAGARGPRFGENSGCRNQENPITYPFQSYDGNVTFSQPEVGNRALDFNTEGMVHIGLVAELIEDVRHDGVSDAELEPLFKSAEGYIRMWEKAEARSAVIAP